MMAKISEWLNKLSNNLKLKKTLFYLICGATFLYIFSIPSFSSRERIYVLAYIFMAILLGLSIVYIVIYRDFSFDRRTLIIPGFVLFCFVGTLLFSHEFRDYLTLVLMTITFYTLLVAFSAIKKSEIIFEIITFAFVAFAIYYVIIYRNEILNVSKYTGDSFRLGWYFDNPNTIGIFMNVGISISMYLALFTTRKINLLFLLSTLLFFVIGFTTGSRTFIILSLVSVVVMLFFRLKKHWIIFIIVLASLITLFIILLNTPLLATMRYRLLDTLAILTGTGNAGGTAGSTTERILWLQYGTYFGSRHAFFGLGMDGFAVFSGTRTYTHANFSEVLCDFGLPGFILFYSALLIPAVMSILSKKKEKYFVVTAIVAFFLEGFFSVYFYSKVTFVLLAICYYVINDVSFTQCIKERKTEYFKKNKLVYYDYCEIDI